MLPKLLAILILSSLAFSSGSKRPFFNIGHMVNSIDAVDAYLKLDSNVLEFDVRFNPDGSIKKVYHGSPCDKGRVCNDTADLGEYLEYIKNLTDPCVSTNFNRQLVMLFFDLKLTASENKTRSGKEVLANIVEHLWTEDGSRKQEMRVLLYIERSSNFDFIHGFLKEVKSLGLEPLLKNIGFDGGQGDLNETLDMFKRLNASVNVWHNEGITNLRPMRDDTKLEALVSVRDSPASLIQKVYDWTVDEKEIIRIALRLGVDGIMTNKPKDLAEVLGEPEFEGGFRMATIEDNPFSRFEE